MKFDIESLPCDLKSHVFRNIGKIEQVVVSNVSVRDVGLANNHPSRPAYFKSGEWTQQTFTMRYLGKSTFIWMFSDNREKRYKLSFDAVPRDFGSLPFLTKDEVIQKTVKAMLELIGTPYREKSDEELIWDTYYPTW